MNTSSKPKKKRAGRPRQPEPLSFLFEIKDWEPIYSLGLSHDPFFDGPYPYREHMHIDFDAICIRPEKYHERAVKFTLVGKRNYFEPETSKSDPNWKPKCIGSLELRNEGSSFYASVPHDSMGFLMNALAGNLFKFVHLWGGQLKRGVCLNTELRLMKSVNPDDY